MLTDGAELSSSAEALGDAGVVSLQGLNGGRVGHLAISGGSSITTTAARGQGGKISVNADEFRLTGLSSIEATVTEGKKPGGDIILTSRNLTLSDGAKIASESQGEGLAGDITINFANKFISYNGIVSTDSEKSDGGNININGGYMLRLRDHSAITTSVGTGIGTGGNIAIGNNTIYPRFVILDSSTIRANAFGGPGGTVKIKAAAFISSADSVIEAVGKQSRIEGTIDIQAPDTGFIQNLAPLPAEFEDPAARLGDRCSQRRDVDQSTYSTAVRDGLPLGPEVYFLDSRMQSKTQKQDGAVPYGSRSLEPGCARRLPKADLRSGKTSQRRAKAGKNRLK
jgi:hypothetical protein